MEKAADVRCVKAPFSWSDVGGWRALYDHIPADVNGNLVQEADVFAHEATGNLVFSSQAGEEVGLLGVDNLVVVRSQGQTLIAHKDKVEELKKLLAQRENL
jgi:mannose-1-phosphate guanylyltransferase/mannose-6-phosphate isomerase